MFKCAYIFDIDIFYEYKFSEFKFVTHTCHPKTQTLWLNGWQMVAIVLNVRLYWQYSSMDLHQMNDQNERFEKNVSM